MPEAIDELPSLLAGKATDTSSLHTQIGSNDFSRRPVAIVIGGGYDDESYDKLLDACGKACGGSRKEIGTVFLRADNNLTDRLVAEGKGPAKKTPEYSAAITKRLKDKLAELGIAPGMQCGLRTDLIGELVLY